MADHIMVYNKDNRICPKCSGKTVRRIHRGFIRKHILKSEPLYKCSVCKEKFSQSLIKISVGSAI